MRGRAGLRLLVTAVLAVFGPLACAGGPGSDPFATSSLPFLEAAGPTAMPSLARYPLDGHVADGITGQPVAATVILQAEGGEVVVKATCGANGDYSMGMVRDGRYELHVTAPGYDPSVAQYVHIRRSTLETVLTPSAAD